MTTSWKSEIARRPLIAGVMGILGIAVVGGAVYELPVFFRRRYPPTPFDDLLDRLPDRENARRLGATAVKMNPAFDVAAAARQLRATFGHKPLSDVMEADLDAHHLIELNGWILPQSLVVLCALAAKAA